MNASFVRLRYHKYIYIYIYINWMEDDRGT